MIKKFSGNKGTQPPSPPKKNGLKIEDLKLYKKI